MRGLCQGALDMQGFSLNQQVKFGASVENEACSVDAEFLRIRGGRSSRDFLGSVILQSRIEVFVLLWE